MSIDVKAYLYGKRGLVLPGMDIVSYVLGRMSEGTHNEPVIFHSIEDGNLILLGVYSTNSTDDGLYLDCNPV